MSQSRRIWQAPVVLACASVVGLVSALVADGAADALSWIFLAGPVVVCWWCYARSS